MTTTTTTDFGSRGRLAAPRIRRLLRVAGSFLTTIGSRWNDLVDAGQLGPSAEALTSRHTGGRI